MCRGFIGAASQHHGELPLGTFRHDRRRLNAPLIPALAGIKGVSPSLLPGARLLRPHPNLPPSRGKGLVQRFHRGLPSQRHSELPLGTFRHDLRRLNAPLIPALAGIKGVSPSLLPGARLLRPHPNLPPSRGKGLVQRFHRGLPHSAIASCPLGLSITIGGDLMRHLS